MLPCIAGHVGADTAGMILSEAPYEQETVNLSSTWGRTRRSCWAAAPGCWPRQPHGPAFEGAQISSGQRAAPGAIERVRIDRQTLEPRFG